MPNITSHNMRQLTNLGMKIMKNSITNYADVNKYVTQIIQERFGGQEADFSATTIMGLAKVLCYLNSGMATQEDPAEDDIVSLGFTRKQAKVLIENSTNLEAIDGIDMNGEVTYKELAKNEDAPPKIVPASKQNLITSNVIEKAFNSTFLKRVWQKGNLPKYLKGEQSPDDKENIINLNFANYMEGKLKDMDAVESHTIESPMNANEVAEERFAVFAALKDRSEKRTWGDVFKHPFKTFKEYRLRKKAEETLKTKYDLTDDNLTTLYKNCYRTDGQGNEFEGFGKIDKFVKKANTAPQKTNKEPQNGLEHIKDDVEAVVASQNLSKRIDKNQTKETVLSQDEY